MTYTLNIDKPALTLFKKLPKPIQVALIEKAQILKTKPTTGEPLKGKYRLLRSLHLSLEGITYRIIYQVFQTSETIVIRLAATAGKYLPEARRDEGQAMTNTLQEAIVRLVGKILYGKR